MDLTYRDETADGPVASLVSLLAQVTVTGLAPGAGPQPLPPLTFTYRDWDPTRRRYRPLPGLLPPVRLGGAFDLVDLFADGLPSVIELDGAARYWRNLGNAAIEPARPLSAVPAGATLGSPGVLLSDVDGDGRPELAVTAGGRTTVWSLASATAARPASIPGRVSPPPCRASDTPARKSALSTWTATTLSTCSSAAARRWQPPQTGRAASARSTRCRARRRR